MSLRASPRGSAACTVGEALAHLLSRVAFAGR
jgi:hypothetical protein